MKTKIKINHENLFTENPSEILSCALARMDLPYWSYDALREFLFGSLDMLIEFCREKRPEVPDKSSKSKLTSFVRKANLMKKHFPENQGRAVSYIYNQILSCEGMALLPGFGMSNVHKDNLKGNPEIRSIYK